MSAEETAAKLKNVRQWLQDRPWLRNMTATLVWIVAIFGVQNSGGTALGVAFIVAAVVISLMLGSIAVADYISRGAADATQNQRARSIAMALALGAVVMMFYAATIARMGKNVVSRPLVVVGSVWL